MEFTQQLAGLLHEGQAESVLCMLGMKMRTLGPSFPALKSLRYLLLSSSKGQQSPLKQEVWRGE